MGFVDQLIDSSPLLDVSKLGKKLRIVWKCLEYVQNFQKSNKKVLEMKNFTDVKNLVPSKYIMHAVVTNMR